MQPEAAAHPLPPLPAALPLRAGGQGSARGRGLTWIQPRVTRPCWSWMTKSSSSFSVVQESGPPSCLGTMTWVMVNSFLICKAVAAQEAVIPGNFQGNVPSLGNKPRDASTTRLQVQLQATDKGVAGFSPCFTLPAVQSPQRSSEKSWTPPQTKLSTQKEMMPHP